MPVNEGVRVDEKDFRQAMKWYRRAPVTHVAPESGSLTSPQKKDVTRREKARVWFPRPAGCSMGMKPSDVPQEENASESAYGALAVYREKHVVTHGPAEKVTQPEAMNAPEVPLADTMTEDNPPHDVDYTVVSDEDDILQLGMSNGEVSGERDGEAADPFAGMIASVETGIAVMMAEKPVPGKMPFPAGGADTMDGEDDDGEMAPELAGLSEEELAEIAGFDLSLLREDESAAAEEVTAGLSEEERAEIAGFDPVLLVADPDEGPPEDGMTAEGANTALAEKGILEEGLSGENAAEDAPEAALMDMLMADEAAALAEEEEEASSVMAEPLAAMVEAEAEAEPGDVTLEDSLAGENAVVDAAEALLGEALIADEAAALADEREGLADAMAGPVLKAGETEAPGGDESASDGMMIAEASGFDAIMGQAEDEARHEALAESVLDAEPDILSAEEEMRVAEIVDMEEAISEAEAAGEDTAGFDAALAEAILADVLPKEGITPETEADEADSRSAFDGMMITEASGFDAIVGQAEDEARHDALVQAVLDAEPDILSAEEEMRVAEIVDMEEAISEAEAAGEDVAGFDAALAEAILADVMPKEGDVFEAQADDGYIQPTAADVAEDLAGMQHAALAEDMAAHAEEVILEESLSEKSTFEDAAEAVLMDALIADEAAALAEEREDTAGMVAEPGDAMADLEEAADTDMTSAPDASAREEGVLLETSLPGEDAIEAVAESALIADEAAGLAEEREETAGVREESEVDSGEAETPGADEPPPSENMMIAAASGFDAIVAQAEDEARHDALAEAVLDAEPEILSGEAEAMVAEIVDRPEAISGAEAAGEDDAGFDAAMAEDILADVMPYEAAVPEEMAEQSAAETEGGMTVAEASGFDAIVAQAEEETRHEARIDSVLNTEPEVFSAEAAAMVVEIADREEAFSGEARAETAGEALSGARALAETVPAVPEAIRPDDPEEAEAAGAAALEEAEPAGVSEAARETQAVETAADTDGAMPPSDMPDPEVALADGIRMVEGETPPDFDVPPVPVLDEMTRGPEVAIPEEQVFRDKIETHQRNKMAFAEYKVAAAYAREDTEASRREMVKWYTRAAENGHAVSQFNLGNIYYAGRGVAQDYETAAHWYELAAAQGVARAQDNLGLMYFHGRGREVDPAMAVYWFRHAAIQGYAPAQYKLAMHLEAGVGTEPDLEEALHWYKKAASQGDAKAQKEVARLMAQQEA